ncbi:hypothetical protein [Streptomyces mirabilis]|uniref:hypothetical protein n=1 Tax=Streptomyces mirabilis TaxID=68239 RepID=UPI0036D997A1
MGGGVAFRQIRAFQRGPVVVLRSGDPDLVRQEIWAHPLTVHHRLTRIIVGLADDNGIDPGRVSFIKVHKHSRRSVVRPCSDTPTKIKEFLVMLAAKAHRKLDNGIRRLREADWHLRRSGPKYSSKLSYRINTRDRRPTRRIMTKGSFRDVEDSPLSITDHGEQDVDTSSSQGEHGPLVLFLLGPLATPQLPSPLRLDNNTRRWSRGDSTGHW